jgi:UDP-glucose 4-epimerase
MRVLVTGGAGFIGSHVVDRLRAAGHTPRVFDLRRSPWHARGEVEAAVGSLLDPRALRSALRGCGAVAHLAAAADVGEVAKRPAWAEELNARGTLNVLEAVREAGVTRLIYASTIWVYDGAGVPEVDEDAPLGAPAHLYTATKLAGEHYCRSYAELYGLEPTILRFGIPYGPRARPAAVIPAFVGKAMRGEALTVAGTGEQSRRFVYVEDLAEGVVRALDPAAANRTYNLVGDEDVSVREIAETVRALVRPVPIEHVPGRAADFAGARVCGERARRELGWTAVTPFVEGVRRYVDWQQAHEAAALAATATSALRRIVTAGAAFVGVALALLLAVVGGMHATDDERAFVAAALATAGAALAAGAESSASRRAAAWLGAFLTFLVIFVPGVRGALGLHHPDPELALLITAGAAAGAALAAGGRRALRPSDA